MGHDLKRQLGALLLLPALLAGTVAVRAANSDLYLAGLGLHQETGRNIYLGGIYLERETPRPQNLAEAPGTRVMEYRVIARRTSIRSLLGGMLLQSEVATGRPPDRATTDFADAILSAVSTSLYAGDSLKIVLTSDNVTTALLNGHELARVESAEVADYLLMGWVGESGPSTVFRNHITADEVDPLLLSELETVTFSPQREAEIARWLEPAPEPAAAPATVADQPAAAAEIAASHTQLVPVLAPVAVAATPWEAPADTRQPTPSPVASPVADTATDVHPADAVTDDAVADDAVTALAATTNATATLAAAPSAADAAGATAGQVAADTAGSPAEQTIQVASLMPAAGVTTVEDEIRALDVQEYFQRLSTFHSRLVSMVYGEISYPKRAVRRDIEGRLELDVTLSAEGELKDIAIAVSSGHQLLDNAAMEAAQAAFRKTLDEVDPVAIAEFGDFSSAEMTVPVPVSFQLH